jgi:branched-subunit amino acid transport protein
VRGSAGERRGGGVFREDVSLDPRSFRLRNFLAIALAAVFTAAVLRHVLHVYGGISREEIRADALLAILIAAVATILFRRMSGRRQR